MLRLEDHKVLCRWHKEIGEVEFKTVKLDASSYYKFSALRDKREGWKIKDSYLKYDEDDNQIIVILSYECPDAEKKLDPEKKLFIEFSDDLNNLITCYTEDKFSGSVVNAIGAMDYLKEMEVIYGKYRGQLASYDRRLAKKQRSVIKERIHRYAVRRKNGVKNLNHLWTRRVVQFAQQKCAGHVVVIDLPKESLGEYPFGWFYFKTFLKYKIEEIGGTVDFVETKKEKKKAA
jgi:transposase